MTDTTDTGGKMHSLAINAPQPLNITFTDGSQLIFPLSGKASFTGDVEESARVFFDAVIRHRDSQLEAERQRADDEAALNKHLDLAIRQSEGVNANLRRLAEKAEAKISALKSKLANPVVLSDCSFEAVSHMAHWYSEGECVAWVSGAEHVKKQIVAAGFPVREE